MEIIQPRKESAGHRLGPDEVARLLFEACAAGRPRLAVRYAKMSAREMRDARHFDPLILAAFHGRASTVKALLPLSDPMAVDDLGCTALMWAAVNGQLDALNALVGSSDVRAADHLGATALMKAAAVGREACVLALSEASDIDAADSQGRTALMWAAMNARAECVEALAGRASRMAVCHLGNSALMWAAGGNHGQGRAMAERELRCVEALMGHGHPDIAAPSGVRAAEVAELRGARGLASRIRSRAFACDERGFLDAELGPAPRRERARAL